MFKTGLTGVVAIALLGLAACGQKSGQPAPYSNTQAGWPAAQNGQPGGQANGQPMPPQGAYPQAVYPQQGPYAQGPQGVYPQGGYPQPQGGGYPGGYPSQAAPQGGPLQVMGAPQGMRPLRSQAGYVFTTQLGGSPQASKLVQGVIQGVSDYFDGPPQILGQQTDPSDHMSQVAFRATLRGAPVLGQIGVVGDGRGGGQGFLMFDSADRAPQTMNAMIAATRGGY